MGDFVVVITVPHGRESVGNYDKIGKIMAEELTGKLESYEVDVKLIMGDIERRFCDLNREFCTKEKEKRTKSTNFRTTLTNFVKSMKSSRKRVFVLDVHSYTKRKLRRKNELRSKLDCYILDNYHGYNPIRGRKGENVKNFSFLVNHCVEYLKGKNIKIEKYAGKVKNQDGGNDIMDEMNTLGIETLLIEFNEDKSIDRNKMISGCVVDWVISYFNASVVSPISGIITKVEDEKLTVYIRSEQDDHKIYASEDSSTQLNVEGFHGTYKFPDFISEEDKRGYLFFCLPKSEFKIFVGKGYVTLKKERKIKKGEVIGEIVVKANNSLAEVFLLGKTFNPKFFKRGYKLWGGKSCLVHYNNWSKFC